MSLTIYGLKNCDTCKKAISALETAGHGIAFVDIRAEADLSVKVPEWLSAIGPGGLVNKRSTTWRGLSDADKTAAEKGEVEALLIANPTLIKRPIMESGEKVYCGFAKEVQSALLKS